MQMYDIRFLKFCRLSDINTSICYRDCKEIITAKKVVNPNHKAFESKVPTFLKPFTYRSYKNIVAFVFHNEHLSRNPVINQGFSQSACSASRTATLLACIYNKYFDLFYALCKSNRKVRNNKEKRWKRKLFSHNLYTYYIYKPISLPILEVTALRILTEW